jgi:cell division protein FtsL
MKESRTLGAPTALLLLTFFIFAALFVYSSLNLKNIDYGYEMQELSVREKLLREEIDKLRAERARLLNLERVEATAIGQLGYQYPESSQIIKVFEDEHGR